MKFSFDLFLILEIFFSRSHSRRLILENMKLSIKHSTATEFNFQSKLFKMQTDQLSFERFEELFDEEDEELPNEPLFDNEWKFCKVNKLKKYFRLSS